MFRLALTTLRYRTAAFLAIFVALLLGSALLAAAGGLLETGLRLNAPPQRLDAAPSIVTGDPAYHPPNGSGSAAFAERHRVDRTWPPSSPVRRESHALIADRSFPAVLTSSNSDVLIGHGWASAPLTPYSLTTGRAPTAGQVVLDQRLAGSAKPGDRITVIVQRGAAGVHGGWDCGGAADGRRTVGVLCGLRG